jgi:fatty acid desaturase
MTPGGDRNGYEAISRVLTVMILIGLTMLIAGVVWGIIFGDLPFLATIVLVGTGAWGTLVGAWQARKVRRRRNDLNVERGQSG